MTDARPTHELKTWPTYFQEIHIGRKNFEVRKNDRQYRQFDVLQLREWDPEVYERTKVNLLAQGYAHESAEEIATDAAYTGRECNRMVGYILYGGDPALVTLEAAHSGIALDYVVMSLVSTPDDAAKKRAAYEAGRPAPLPLKSVRVPGSVADEVGAPGHGKSALQDDLRAVLQAK